MRRFHDLQPVLAWSRRLIIGADADDISGLQRSVQRYDGAVDRRADGMMTDLGMDAIGKIDRRGTIRQRDDFSLRRQHIDIGLEDIALHDVHVFQRIVAFLIAHHREILEPMQLFLDFLLFALLTAILRFFVTPMRGDTSLGDLIHLLRADLHLEDIAVLADDRRVQATDTCSPSAWRYNL